MIEQSESIKNLAIALLKAQKELGAVQENATNPFFKSKYADLGEHIKTIKPAFEKHGLVISQFLTGNNNEMGVTTMLMHESGEYLKSTAVIPMEQEKGNSKAQTAGKAISYLRRYALAAVANVYSGDDNDGNVEVKSVAKDNTKSAKKETKAKSWPAEYVQAVIETGSIDNTPHAVGWLNLVNPKSVELVGVLMTAYQKEKKSGLTSPEAADAVQELNK